MIVDVDDGALVKKDPSLLDRTLEIPPNEREEGTISSLGQTYEYNPALSTRLTDILYPEGLDSGRAGDGNARDERGGAAATGGCCCSSSLHDPWVKAALILSLSMLVGCVVLLSVAFGLGLTGKGESDDRNESSQPNDGDKVEDRIEFGVPTNSPSVMSLEPSYESTTPETAPPMTAPSPTRAPIIASTPTPSFMSSFSKTDLSSEVPSETVSLQPISAPSYQPSLFPTSPPTDEPTKLPTEFPTEAPTNSPTQSNKPSMVHKPSSSPSASFVPTEAPTNNPTPVPTDLPSNAPTHKPTRLPTKPPSRMPTRPPTSPPSKFPTKHPTIPPSPFPSRSPTPVPTTKTPTQLPTRPPTNAPTAKPSAAPTQCNDEDGLFRNQHNNEKSCDWLNNDFQRDRNCGTDSFPITELGFACRLTCNAYNGCPAPPSKLPTRSPTSPPSRVPTEHPTTLPTPFPSRSPTPVPTTKAPTPLPTRLPTNPPSKLPTRLPTSPPSRMPTRLPTNPPSGMPTKHQTIPPSPFPSRSATQLPTTKAPTPLPTRLPTNPPTKLPTKHPTIPPSPFPSRSPTPLPTFSAPTQSPTRKPTSPPSKKPTKLPTIPPSPSPSRSPSQSSIPTRTPTKNPTHMPVGSPDVSSSISSFYLMGGILEDPAAQSQLPTLLSEFPTLSEDGGETWLIHLGDFNDISGNGGCPESSYSDFDGDMQHSSIPVFVLPGDEEWNDCPDVDQAWDYWTAHFGGDYNSRYWASPDGYTVSRQTDGTVANFAFAYRRVLHVGLNLVGGFVHDGSEWDVRLAANLEWIENNVEVQRGNIDVVIIYGNQGMNDGAGRRNRFYRNLSDLVESSIQIPTMIVFDRFKPFDIEENALGVPNFMMMNIEGRKWPPMKVTVDTNAGTFLFEQGDRSETHTY